MAVFNEPTQWGTSLVVNGDTNVIPQSTPAGSGALSFDDGFPQITQVPLGAGGIAPDRKDFNAVMKLLGDAVFYMQNGGFWSYNPLFDYAVGRVVLYTDGIDVNLYKCIQANGSLDPKAPTDSAYWSKILTLNDFSEFGFNTGDFKPLTSNTIPNGWLLGNGATVNRSICPKLVQFAYDNDLVRDSTEQASYESDPDHFTGRIYGPGDGSTTIQIPNLRGRSLMGALASTSVGRYVPEQLPNIVGEFTPDYAGNGEANNATGWTSFSVGTGALFLKNDSLTRLRGSAYASSSYAGGNLGLDSSLYNSTYTDNGHVYPASIALNFIIKT